MSVTNGATPRTVRLEDFSSRRRFGLKGPAAEAWLNERGFDVPPGANSARIGRDGVLVARLATSEFLIEDIGAAGESVQGAWRALESAHSPAGVYPVLRQDFVAGISGSGLPALLRQICNVDFDPVFEAHAAADGPVVLTSMAGVGVVAWPVRAADRCCITLWMDPSFAHYFQGTLSSIAQDIAR
jgi:sarcosine oxidase subunit gamma